MGLAPWHILLIAIVALVMFGPNKLPELGRGFGKMFREFKDATNGNSGNSGDIDSNASRKEIPPNDVSRSDDTPSANK